MDVSEVLAGAWYTHPLYDGQVIEVGVSDGRLVGLVCDLTSDHLDLYWRANGIVVEVTDELAEGLQWAWGGPTRTVTLCIEVPVGDPEHGSSIIDPITNLLLDLQRQGLVGDDDESWWWES